MATAVAGHEGRFTTGGVNLYLNKWSINFTADDITTRTFESSGYDSGIGGFIGAEVSIEGYWDLDQSPHASPPGFRVGLAITGSTYLYVRKTGNRRYVFTSLRVLSVPVQNESEGKCMYSVTMKSNGAWTYAS